MIILFLKVYRIILLIKSAKSQKTINDNLILLFAINQLLIELFEDRYIYFYKKIRK